MKKKKREKRKNERKKKNENKKGKNWPRAFEARRVWVLVKKAWLNVSSCSLGCLLKPEVLLCAKTYIQTFDIKTLALVRF